MNLMEPKPGFQGHGIFEVEYIKNGAFQEQSY